MPADLTDRATFRLWMREITRFGDTDLLGHVNNAVFATFYESGRTKFLFNRHARITPPGSSFVIARLAIDFRLEMHYDQEIDVGSVVLAMGRSSFHVGQALFRGEECVSTAESVLVMFDETTRRSTPLTDDVRARLQEIALAS